MGLKAFQKKTVKRAVRVLTGKGSQRFLVADEVGLGKTLVAVDVVRKLAERQRKTGGRPLRVFYLCSNLAIGQQNRRRFSRLKGLETTKVDRLTLVPAGRRMSDGASVHFYTLTANTSFPDRKGKSRAGTWQERALLHNLLLKTHRSSVDGDWLKGKRVKRGNWPWYLSRGRVQPSAELLDQFRQRLVVKGKLQDRRGVSGFMGRWREEAKNDLVVIGALRKFLAEIALSTVAPDLVILDEFQRFRDLMHVDEGGTGRVAQLLLNPTHHTPPAVLLLSATPYRAFDSTFERMFGDKPHHAQLLELFSWLEGGGETGKRSGKRLEEAFQAYGQALRHAPDSSAARDARDALQKRLRRRIARTERFRHEHGQEAAPPPVALEAPVEVVDLLAFRHTAKSFEAPAGQRSYEWCAVPYWRSVPLPMQTLGNHYVAWKEAKKSGQIPPMPSGASLAVSDREAFLAPATWPNPQLRALMTAYPSEQLATPWVAPSRPWWSGAGPWVDGQGPSKSLVFSRFLAVPRALSTLLSYEVERNLAHGGKEPTHDYAKSIQQRPLHFTPETLALFHPATWLVDCVDPSLAGSPEAAVEAALECLFQRAKDASIEVLSSRTATGTYAELIARVEGGLKLVDESRAVWTQLAATVAKPSGKKEGGEHSLGARVQEWLVPLEGEGQGSFALTMGDLQVLARGAVEAPGVVLARAVSRFWSDWHRTDVRDSTREKEAPLLTVLRASWQGLRAYLNNPWFPALMLRFYGSEEKFSGVEQRYGAHLRRAVVDGNLESVLDEHLYMLQTLRSVHGAALCRELQSGLVLRVASPTLHHPGEESFTLRAHAAMPFSNGVSVARAGQEEKEDQEEKARADELRTSFNSPFWPHVLITTSVGQEGLDFHVWCDTIVHWDLPSNPVDLEQREGRVNRFGGLSVRRALANHPTCASARTWTDIANVANTSDDFKESTGLSPWWILEGATVERRIFHVPLSDANQAFADLQRKRLLYRLALGQPDQESFVRALPESLSTASIRELTIDLG